MFIFFSFQFTLSGKECYVVVRKRMQHKNPKVALMALEVRFGCVLSNSIVVSFLSSINQLIEMLVKNCGFHFFGLVAKQEFLDDLAKMAKKSSTVCLIFALRLSVQALVITFFFGLTLHWNSLCLWGGRPAVGGTREGADAADELGRGVRADAGRLPDLPSHLQRAARRPRHRIPGARHHRHGTPHGWIGNG